MGLGDKACTIHNHWIWLGSPEERSWPGLSSGYAVSVSTVSGATVITMKESVPFLRDMWMLEMGLVM